MHEWGGRGTGFATRYQVVHRGSPADAGGGCRTVAPLRFHGPSGGPQDAPGGGHGADVAAHLVGDCRAGDRDVAAGGVIGVVSALVGIGGGSMTVPLLTWRGVAPVRATLAAMYRRGTSRIGLMPAAADDVVPRQHLGRRRLERQVPQRAQMRLVGDERFPRAGVGGDGADLHLGVGGEQPQDLTAGVAGGAGDGDRRGHCSTLLSGDGGLGNGDTGDSTRFAPGARGDRGVA